MALASLFALAAPLLVGSVPAGAAATTDTGHTHHGVRTFYDIKPCAVDGVGYEIQTTSNSVEHETDNASGAHFTFTETGTFTARPAEVVRDADGNPIRNDDDELTPALDADGQVVYLPGATFAGHFTTWGGGHVSRGGSGFTFTFSVHGVGTDGTTFGQHSVFHSTSWPGDPDDPSLVKVMFDHEVCR
jgi:hypothetical protein